jgi:predicted enzyme related to lactoylglutathione lyase/uncharacterized protein YndB with AHSA1/START domain
MTKMTSYPQGRFCWIELSADDVSAAKKFYGPLLGWSWDEHPMGPGEVYTMAKIDNGQVCGLFTLKADQKKQGVPPNWGVYVSVDNADKMAKEAERLGGKIIVPPFDVMDVGRMAVIQDPTGAVFNLWQAKKHSGGGAINEPGAFDWFELMTTDPAKAAEYYAKLFGWTTNVMDMGTMKYTMCMLGETGVAGILPLDPKMKAPPSWVVYFNVSDVSATVRNARETGAQTLVPPTEIPNMVKFALLQDPQHAVFGVAQSLKASASTRIHQEITFNATPERVYRALMTSSEHAKFTGSPAEISNDEGGTFKAHDGWVSGRNVHLAPNKRIVQAWRAQDWPEGTYSLVRFELRSEGNKTRLVFDHDAIPEGHVDHLTSGWVKMYWEPLRKYLET